MAVGPARGMRDFPPRDKERRDGVMSTIRSTYLRHGFEEIETPAIEDSSTLFSGLGGDNEKLSFQILKRGLEAADLHQASSPRELSDLGLRYDLTVPLARFYATHHADLPTVFRAFHQGPVWRAERPQKGRYRQFIQCDIDILGEPGALAEIEVLLATDEALRSLGLQGYTFRVGDRRLLQELLTSAGVKPESQAQALISIDKLDKIGKAGVLEELADRIPSARDLEALNPVLDENKHPLDASHIASLMGGTTLASEVASHLVSWVEQALEVRPDLPVVFDPTLVRGMGYYTGTIIEISHPGLGISLGGGGRYDGMIGRFLGSDVAAFGVSLGFERLLEVVPEGAPGGSTKVALIYGADVSPSTVATLKTALVGEGNTVRLVAQSKNMRPVFERLVADGFQRVAEVTPTTTALSTLTFRDLSSP